MVKDDRDSLYTNFPSYKVMCFPWFGSTSIPKIKIQNKIEWSLGSFLQNIANSRPTQIRTFLKHSFSLKFLYNLPMSTEKRAPEGRVLYQRSGKQSTLVCWDKTWRCTGDLLRVCKYAKIIYIIPYSRKRLLYMAVLDCFQRGNPNQNAPKRKKTGAIQASWRATLHIS